MSRLIKILSTAVLVAASVGVLRYDPGKTEENHLLQRDYNYMMFQLTGRAAGVMDSLGDRDAYISLKKKEHEFFAGYCHHSRKLGEESKDD